MKTRLRWLRSILAIALLLGMSNYRTMSGKNTSPSKAPEETSLPQESSYHSQTPLLAELTQLQKENGLTIAWYEDGLQLATFDHRSSFRTVQLSLLEPKMAGAVSSDGTRVSGRFLDSTGRLTLGIIGFDGSDPKEYKGIAPIDFCWSRDSSSIALTNSQGRHMANLEILNVDMKTTQIIQGNFDERWHFTSQCWSPDDKQLVLEADGTSQIYDIGSGKIRILVKGTNPTWSPDGNWITFRDHDIYYAIRPDGTGRKELFHKKNLISGLYWSPDSQFVAYVSLAGVLEGGILPDVDTYRLRVRRLQDNAEDWVLNGASCCINYQWVVNKKLFTYVESRTTEK